MIHLKTDGTVITQEDEAVKQLCSQNPRIVSHSEVTAHKEYKPLAAKEENEAEPEDLTSQEKHLVKKRFEIEVTSQKQVTLRDASRYFMLRYNEQG